jgi:hypothetical protein
MASDHLCRPPGVGAGIVPSWRRYLQQSVFIVAEGDRQVDYFREGHDIVVPGKASMAFRVPSECPLSAI